MGNVSKKPANVSRGVIVSNFGEEKLFNSEFFKSVVDSDDNPSRCTESDTSNHLLNLPSSMEQLCTKKGVIEAISYSIKRAKALFDLCFFSTCVTEEEYGQFVKTFSWEAFSKRNWNYLSYFSKSDEIIRDYDDIVKLENSLKMKNQQATLSTELPVLINHRKAFLYFLEEDGGMEEAKEKPTKGTLFSRVRKCASMLIDHVGLFNVELCWIIKDQKYNRQQAFLRKASNKMAISMKYGLFGRYHIGFSVGGYFAHFCTNAPGEGFVDVFSIQEKPFALGNYYISIPLLFVIPDEEILSCVTESFLKCVPKQDNEIREIGRMVVNKVTGSYHTKFTSLGQVGKYFSLVEFTKAVFQAIHDWGKDSKYDDRRRNCQHFFFSVMHKLCLVDFDVSLPYQYFYFDLNAKKLVKRPFSCQLMNFIKSVWKCPQTIHFPHLEIEGSCSTLFLEFIHRNRDSHPLQDYDVEILRVACSYYLRRSALINNVLIPVRTSRSLRTHSISSIDEISKRNEYLNIGELPDPVYLGVHQLLNFYIDITEKFHEKMILSLEDFRMDWLDSITLDKEIGSGICGTVYFVSSKKVNYAFKKFRDGNKADLHKICQILFRIEHPNVVKFFGFGDKFFNGRNRVGIVFEVCDTSMRLYLEERKKSFNTITLCEKIGYLKDVSNAMEYLHLSNVIHRDLKWENILCVKSPDGKIICKVGDFGTSKVFDVGTNHTMRVGSPWYCDWDVLFSKCYDLSVDVFSFSILMYTLFFMRFDLSDDFYDEPMQFFKDKKKRPSFYQLHQFDIQREELIPMTLGKYVSISRSQLLVEFFYQLKKADGNVATSYPDLQERFMKERILTFVETVYVVLMKKCWSERTRFERPSFQDIHLTFCILNSILKEKTILEENVKFLKGVIGIKEEEKVELKEDSCIEIYKGESESFGTLTDCGVVQSIDESIGSREFNCQDKRV